MKRLPTAWCVGILVASCLILSACDNSHDRVLAYVEKTRQQDIIAKPLADCMLSKANPRALRDIGISEAERSTMNPNDSFMTLEPVVRTQDEGEVLIRKAAVQVAVACGEPQLEWEAFPGPASRPGDRPPEHPDPKVAADFRRRVSAFVQFQEGLKVSRDYQRGYMEVMLPRIAKKRRADAEAADNARSADRQARDWAVKPEGPAKPEGITAVRP